MKYKAILFDLGDTLIESHPTEAQILIERMIAAGVAVPPEVAGRIPGILLSAANAQIARERAGAGRMPDDQFRQMLEIAALSAIVPEADVPAHFDKLQEVAQVEPQLRVIPGVPELLSELRARGYRLGVVSNHRAWMPCFLRENQIADFFEQITISDIVGVEKPDSRIMELTLEAMRLAAHDCAYVGDHPFDVLCAKACGMDCVWIAPADAELPPEVPYREDFRARRAVDILPFFD